MTKVEFYDPSWMPDGKLIYSVIAARFKGLWIFVRHHKRSTWEIAGGHIEEGETSYNAARRELNEETGAEKFDIDCISTYSVDKDGEIGYGRLYYADVKHLGPIPDISEIAEITLSDQLPANLTHPDIQPYLFSRTVMYLKEKRQI